MEAGITRAHETLAEQRLFLLTDEQWDEFLAVMDRPVMDKPQLRKLLTEPGALG